MKSDIHPNYEVVTVRCSCGNAFETRSTRSGEQILELCNECHPFFTGKQKLVDSGGRVERFNRRYGERANKCHNPYGVALCLKLGRSPMTAAPL